ncbi:GtrA family protein [Lyngbya sp. CCY1209]|uniref:GtrA family protein n=1 Tax=Lyngbya sp. CCY1209 TaxID=2886103 RepID=UPI002D20534C|nr:GtrA family protein [Lyngbya sp. CCY1209]MEB3883313.1 FAD-dependent oxidoreductase [Lyngbya sp. CCY1209]
MEPIYILGAGPAGLAAAYTLTQQGIPVVVVERDTRVGGLAKSIEYEGFILDFGPHRFFTKLPPVLKLWHQVLGKDQVTVNRLTRIYYGGKYFSYPLRAKQVIFALGGLETIRILTSYFKVRLFPKRDAENFADWVTAKFGRRLFEIFFQGYTEKLWGIPCTEISADWAAQRIKGLSLYRAIINALLGNDGKVKTLVDRFQFPRLGSGQLYDKIAEYLQQNRQPILLNTEVIEVHHNNFQATHVTLRNRRTKEVETVPCGGIISSIPLTLLVEQLKNAPPKPVIEAARSLKFRNTILVYLIVEGNHLFPDNWLYINDPRVQLGRVTNFANWSPEMLPDETRTPLCCEYWCNFEDELWSCPEEELRRLTESELRKIGLLKKQAVSGGFVVRLPRTYPIYAGDYKTSLATMRDYFKRFQNLQLVGRYGAFKYNNQDHSLLMGIMAAENVVNPGKHNLWDVNSDSEYVEEAKADTETTSAAVSGTSRRRRAIALLRQFGGYLFTGGTATIVDVLVFSILTQTGLWYVYALAISYFLGLSTNFWLSRRFVFGVYWRNWRLQYGVFATVALNSLLANLGLLQLLINELGWDVTTARLASAACVALISFTGHKLYSFSSVDRVSSLDLN